MYRIWLRLVDLDRRFTVVAQNYKDRDREALASPVPVTCPKLDLYAN